MRLDLEYAADNAVTFLLNGTPIGGIPVATATTSAFTQLHSLVYAGSLLHDGENRLDAVVTDHGVATGLLVRGSMTGCAVAWVEAGTCVSVTQAGASATTARRIYVSTGANGASKTAVGVQDQHWVNLGPATGQPWTVAPYGPWYSASTGANWINATSTSWSTPEASGPLGTTATYGLDFMIPAGWQIQDLDVRFAADNAVTFTLNGPIVGGFGGLNQDPLAFKVMHPLNYAGPLLHNGVNHLEATVRDFGVVTGLIVEGSVRVCPSEVAAT